MIHTSLHKKTIIILGGAGLLGSAFARACAREGASVIIADVDEKKGRALSKEIAEAGGEASFLKADIADESSLKGLVRTIGKKHPRIDGLVHAAYPKTPRYGALLEKAVARDMLDNMDLQLGGPLLSTRAFMPVLAKGSSVIFLSSIYGLAAPRLEVYEGTSMGVPAEYAAVKGGIIALTRFFAAVLGKKGVRVNAISPGGIFASQPKSFLREYTKKLLLGSSLLSPEDIAGTVIFLLSDASKQMTGQNLIVDGGWTL